MKQVAVLERAWKLGITLQSDFYRTNSVAVALCASLGHISTIDHEGNYGNVWRITHAGLKQLHLEMETEDEVNNSSGYTLDSQAPHRTTYLGFVWGSSFGIQPMYSSPQAAF